MALMNGCDLYIFAFIRCIQSYIDRLIDKKHGRQAGSFYLKYAEGAVAKHLALSFKI